MNIHSLTSDNEWNFCDCCNRLTTALCAKHSAKTAVQVWNKNIRKHLIFRWTRTTYKTTGRRLVMTVTCYGALETVGVIIIIITDGSALIMKNTF